MAIPVGSEYENPTLLSARDWHPTQGRVPWKQIWIDDPAFDANGYWMIDVLAAGRYRIELRTHPREADLPMGVANRRVAAHRRPASISAVCRSQSVMTIFDVELGAGVTSLSSQLVDAAGKRERGAYYVYVSKL